MKKITDDVYRYKIQTSARLPDLNYRLGKNLRVEEFYRDHVYPFSPNEFTSKIYETPCWDYWRLICEDAVKDDSLLLKASWEIVKHYPWYPFAFTARNIWHLLYDPGYAFTRYNINSYGQTSIQDSFPFDISDSFNIDKVPPRAFRELQFDTLENKPKIVRDLMQRMRDKDELHYLRVIKIIFYLMTFAWIAAGLKLFSQILPSKKMQKISNLLPKNITPLVTILTLYLFQNMLIISLFVDPMWRYHNHLMPFKIMLAGMGAWVLIHMASQMMGFHSAKINVQQENQTVKKSNVQTSDHLITLVLGLLMISVFAAWSGYILIHT